MTTTPPLDLATTTPVVPVRPAAGDSDDGDPAAYARVTMEGVPDVQGAQPGTPVQVGGTFSRSFRATAVLEVEADGRSYRATLAPAQSGRWSATVRVYHPGVLRLHATLVVTRTDNDNEALAEDSQQTTVSLARTTVDLAVTSPSGRLVVGMGGLGSGIVARTAVGFGPRRVAWSLDGSPGAAGTAHQDSADPGRFTDQLTVPPNPLGTRTLRARCTPVDTAGREIDPRLATEATTTFTVADGSAPTLDITLPRPYQPYLAPGGTASIDLEGAAGDPQSGVARVEYSVDGAGWTTLGTADGFAHWRTSGVPVSGLGEHTVRIRAVDREPRPAGDTTGTTVRDVPVRLLSDYRPASLAERLDRRGYLGALLGFAYEHLRRADGSAVTIADLEVIGCQSLGALSQALPATAGAAAEPVPRVQAAVEVLRRFLGAGLVAGRWDPRGFADDEIPDLAGSSPIVVAAPTTVVPGRDGRPALVLDGTSGVTVPGNPNLRLGDRGADFTVAFWFRLDQGATGQWRTVLRQGDTDLHRTPGIYLSPGSNSLHVRVTTTAAPNEGIDAGAPLTVGRWTHVVVVKAGLDLLLYLDGRIDRRARLSAPTTAFDGPLFIGDDPWQQPTACAFDSVELLRFAAPENLVLALARSGDDWARHGDPVAQQRAALAHQRSTAYDAMLAALGTSYAELRLARAATAEVRERLADRLGVLLAGATPDPLTQLTLTASQRTDAALELLLGITDTDPARPQPRPQPLPALHRWRVEALTATWSEQDRARTDPRLPVLVDPDVITEADLTPAGRTSVVVALLQARRQQLDGLTAELRQLRSGAATPGDGMTALLARAYPGLDVVALEQERASGHDIGGALAQHDLTAGAFAVLVTATRLAAAGSIEEDDWTEVQDIAVTSLKQALYPTWRSQENDVVLSPDTFRASDSSAAGGWRHPPGRRAAWERVLLVRVSQRSGVEAVLREALDAAEPPALATLRDELLASVEGPSAVGAVGDWLAARLGIDVLAGAGGAATSRLTVAAEFVASLLASVRAGRLAGWHPAGGWTVVDETRFDQGWVWLSGYRAWVAATLAYLYPENLLRPELLPMPTAGFGELVSALRGGAATADQARVLANELLAPLRGALDAALPPPRAAWTFTSGGATDSSSSGVALTYGGGARPSSGLVGPAVTFNGVDGRLDVPRGTALDSIVDDFTLAFWARPAAARSDSGATSDLAGTVGQRFTLGPAQGAETFGSTGDSIAGAGVSVGINGVGVFEHSDTYLREVVGWRAASTAGPRSPSCTRGGGPGSMSTASGSPRRRTRARGRPCMPSPAGSAARSAAGPHRRRSAPTADSSATSASTRAP